MSYQIWEKKEDFFVKTAIIYSKLVNILKEKGEPIATGLTYQEKGWTYLSESRYQIKGTIIWVEHHKKLKDLSGEIKIFSTREKRAKQVLDEILEKI